MVNSSNSRSPILLDTPERPTGAGGNTVIEIPDSGERNPTRRRRLESVDDVIVADSPKRARVDVPVPVIDLTADNEEESSTTDINTERLISSMQNSPRYAELRARLLPDETRLRIRRAISLRNRSTSHHSRHQLEDQSNLHAVMHARAQSMYNNLFGENSGSTILVDDDEAPSTGVPNLYDLASEYSPPSCSRVSPPRISNTTTVSARPTLSTAHRTDRNRPLAHSSLHSQDSVDSESERLGRNSRRDSSYQVRAARRHLRRQRELRERFAYISPFTNYSTNSDDNFERSAQPTEQQTAGINHAEAVPSTFNEAPSERMIRRTPPAFPMEGQLRPYDIPDLLLPAVLQSWWGPDSRLRHFGDADDDREDYEALWSLTERLGQVKPKGLSKADMGEIPAFRYSAASKDSSNGSCVVCMMNYSNREKLRRLPCNHDFHAKCIDRWLKNNRSCPVCRKDVITN